LKTELVAAAEKTRDLKLAISADKSAPFGQIVKVMDAAKEAKIKIVNAFTKEAGKPGLAVSRPLSVVSIPHIPFIMLHLIPLQKLPELFLKAHLPYDR